MPAPRPPLIFISHDSRDAELAEAFGHLLTDASGGALKSFYSSDRKGSAGIPFGSEWYAQIIERLSDATHVVALLTERSLGRPWILYEVGYAKGKSKTSVLGVAVGISFEKATTGPFTQFQNCADDEDSLTQLVLQLVRSNPGAAPREESVRDQVRSFRERIKILANPASHVIPNGTSQDTDAKPSDSSDIPPVALQILKSLFSRGPCGDVKRFASEFSIQEAEVEYYFDRLRQQNLVTKRAVTFGAGGMVPVTSCLTDEGRAEVMRRKGDTIP